MLYATTAEASDNRLITITDTGSGASITTLASAGANVIFKGVSFGPQPLPPTVTLQPSDDEEFPGTPIEFDVAGSATVPISYQWRHDGTNIVGATGTSYFIASCTNEDRGQYDCVLTTVGGSSTSLVATLTIDQTIDFTLPQYGSVSIALTATASSGLPVSYTVLSRPGAHQRHDLVFRRLRLGDGGGRSGGRR